MAGLQRSLALFEAARSLLVQFAGLPVGNPLSALVDAVIADGWLQHVDGPSLNLLMAEHAVVASRDARDEGAAAIVEAGDQPREPFFADPPNNKVDVPGDRTLHPRPHHADVGVEGGLDHADEAAAGELCPHPRLQAAKIDVGGSVQAQGEPRIDQRDEMHRLACSKLADHGHEVPLEYPGVADARRRVHGILEDCRRWIEAKALVSSETNNIPSITMQVVSELPIGITYHCFEHGPGDQGLTATMGPLGPGGSGACF